MLLPPRNLGGPAPTAEKHVWKQGVEAEWKAEDFVANPSVASVIVMMAVWVNGFLLLSWGAASLTDGTWPQVILALFVAVSLIPGFPSDLKEHIEGLPSATKMRFYVPLWIGRTILLIILFSTYDEFLARDGSARWIFLAAMTVLFLPLMWFPLSKMRQAGLSALVGWLRPTRLLRIIPVTVSQTAFGVVAAMAWLASGSWGRAVLLSVLAAVWHWIGNLIILTALVRPDRGRL